MTDSMEQSWLTARILTFEPHQQQRLTAYVRQLFAPEDDVLQQVRQNTVDHDLPVIQIRPEEGQMLHFLARVIGAQRILEIGTLAGYSGIWLARALDDQGQLITLERDPRHAAVAREHFALAGLSDRVQVREGEALHALDELSHEPPFDMVFIDANKDAYPQYLAWALDHVRPGGLITAHNAFQGGAIVENDGSEAVVAIRDMLAAMANHPRLTGTIIPVGDGLAAAIVS